jgi:hypothetical protein
METEIIEIKKMVWELFERTGEIGYYNLYIALKKENK